MNTKDVYNTIVDSDIIGFRKLTCEYSKIIGLEIPFYLLTLNKINKEEFNFNSGLYLLVSNNNDIYIGESENIYNRLMQHNKNFLENEENDNYMGFDSIEKAYVIIYEEMNKTELKLIEEYLIEIFSNLNDWTLRNKTKKYNNSLEQESNKIKFERKKDEILKFINSLWINTKIESSDKEKNNFESNNVYYIKREQKDSYGEMIIDQNGKFVLIKDKTKIANNLSEKYVSPWVKEKYNEIISKNNDRILKENLIKNKPSLLAVLIIGNTANGWKEWKNKNGEPLEKIRNNFE